VVFEQLHAALHVDHQQWVDHDALGARAVLLLVILKSVGTIAKPRSKASNVETGSTSGKSVPPPRRSSRVHHDSAACFYSAGREGDQQNSFFD
jgi:hypothetical protein